MAISSENAESSEKERRDNLRALPPLLGLALCTGALAWAAAAYIVAARSAAGIAARLHFERQQILIESAFLLFLLVVGFRALEWLSALKSTERAVVDRVLLLPRRQTAAREWLWGAATGWGMCLAAVLPALLTLHFHARLQAGNGLATGIVTSALTLLVVTLAEEVVFRGYPLLLLGQAIGPTWASIFLSAIFAAVLVAGNPPANLGGALLNLFVFGVLLAMAYQRTHALWLGWGIHFAFRAAMLLLLGLPVAGRSDLASLTEGTLFGPRWLSGGGFGLDAALPTLLVLVIAIACVYRLSRGWAWAYTLPEIVSGGHEVQIAPPAAHVAMERAAAPPPLVQIMPSPPPPPIPRIAGDPERES